MGGTMTEEEEHQIIRARGLEEKNIEQASKIMELELHNKRIMKWREEEALRYIALRNGVKSLLEEVTNDSGRNE